MGSFGKNDPKGTGCNDIPQDIVAMSVAAGKKVDALVLEFKYLCGQ